MIVSQCIQCEKFPCRDVKHESCSLPDIEVNPEKISILLISEAAPPEHSDYYYAGGNALFAQTTVLAFQDAGAKVSSIAEIVDLGVYLTTAVKCAKTGYGIETSTIQECALLLDKELSLFPKAKALLLMGDVAIKAVNYLAKVAGEKRVIPAGATYKIRGGDFTFRGMKAFPSYTQAGPSFFIEKSKRRTIAADIAAALSLVS